MRALSFLPPDVPPPGTVIDHLPTAGQRYIGSPSIAILPSGDYVASHDEFGPKSTQGKRGITTAFRSGDRGQTWEKISTIQGAFWSTLFVHRGALYLIGTDKEYGNIVIRRSTTGGADWTTPDSSKTGLLRAEGNYHCAPVPVVERSGRLWRAFEWRNPPTGWAKTFQAGVLSVPVGADLLDAAQWTATNFVPSDRNGNRRDMGGWLEGNVVVLPEGEVIDLLRVETRSTIEKVAMVRISSDGKTASFDPEKGFLAFPGGAKKFTIRFDEKSRAYWALVSLVPPRFRASPPAKVRNTLALVSSPDLMHWDLRGIVLQHPDPLKHGFQYVDWQFDGDDIIAACRTAFDDADGESATYHDANYLTFHRVPRFRDTEVKRLP